MACVEGGAVVKGEMKVACMVILMVLMLLISWLPYASLAMLVVSKADVEIHPLVRTVPVCLPGQEQQCTILSTLTNRSCSVKPFPFIL